MIRGEVCAGVCVDAVDCCGRLEDHSEKGKKGNRDVDDGRVIEQSMLLRNG